MDLRTGASDPEMTANRVAADLGLRDDLAEWLAKLESSRPTLGLQPPRADHLSDLLGILEVPAEDRAEVLQTLPRPERDPHVWWLLERSHQLLAQNMVDRVRQTAPPPPVPPAMLPAPLRLFAVHLILVAIDDIRACHKSLRIPDDVSWETLSHLGNRMAAYRAGHGRTGIELSVWDWMRFFGFLYQVGRLEAIPYRLCTNPQAGPLFWYDQETTARLGRGFRKGDAAISIHIPATEPLAPEACDASIERMRTAFQGVFPGEPPRVATCTSWLLGDQLIDYLPGDSNILAFARRFELVPGSLDNDEAILHSVFGAERPKELDRLPQRTTLERAVVEHIRSGRHWRLRTGWLSLAPDRSA